MDSANATTRYAWQSLRQELERTREHWNDSTSEHFLAYYWQPLEAESERFQQAVDHLTYVLQAALDAAY
ncbi:MAG: hypothetical protein ACPLYD_16610 [Anaerolineae bacterium]